MALPFAYLVILDFLRLSGRLLCSIERMKSHDLCKNLLVLGWNAVHDNLLPFFFICIISSEESALYWMMVKTYYFLSEKQFWYILVRVKTEIACICWANIDLSIQGGSV